MLRLYRQNLDGRAVARVLNGDTGAFGGLVDRYGRAALAVARAIAPMPADAEDLLQEAYVLAYRKLDTLEQPHRFGPWLISITRNVALRARERARETTSLEKAPDTALSATPAPERDEIRAVVRHALGELDADHREVLLLHYFAGNSVAEIADLLEISAAAAKKRLQRARESLSKDLLRALGSESAAAYGLTPRRRRQILAAALASGAAWQGKAHAATVAAASTGAVSFAVKAAVTVTAIGAIATAALVSQRAVTPPEAVPAASEPAVAATDVPGAKTSPEGLDEDALLAAFNATGTLPAGPCSIDADLKSVLGLPVSGATANLERVTWKAMETPPARVSMWNRLSDDKGHVHFDELPPGEYSLVVYTETAGTAVSFYLSPRSPHDADDNVVLMPLQQMDGRVVNTAGEPVDHATLYPISHELTGNDEFGHARVAAARTATNADGRFHFDRVWPGKMRFFVAAEGYAPYKSDWVATSSTPVFTLDQGGTLDLTLVREPGGEPLPGIPIVLTDVPSDRLTLAGTTGPGGSMHFERVSAGNYVLVIDDAALTLINQDPIPIGARENKQTTIHAGAGATILGKVTESDTGEPLAGLIVISQTEPGREAVTADDGAYMLIGVPAGTAQISVSGIAGNSARHYPSGAFGYTSGNTAYRRIDISQGETIENINFDMRRASVVRGRVVDASGASAPNADVNIRRVQCPADVRHIVGVNADDDGYFEFGDLPLQCQFEVFARNETGLSKSVAIDHDSDEEIFLQLSASGCTRLAGPVFSGDGSAISEGSISLAYTDHVVMEEKIKYGRVDFGMVPSGKASYTVFYSSTGDMQYGCAPVEIDLPVGKRLDDQIFTCGPTGDLSLSGWVLLPGGGPAVGATVSLLSSPQTATADAQGWFRIAGVEDADYNLAAKLDGYTAVNWIHVRGGDDDVVMELKPLTRLSGRVVGVSDGLAIAGAKIDLHDQNSSPYAGATVTSAEDGSFAFESVATGSITLFTSLDGYTRNMQDLFVQQDSEIPFVTIKLARPGMVAGVVLGPNGEQIEGAKVSLPRISTGAISNTNGHFELHELEAGVDTTLEISHAEYGKTTLAVVPGAPGSDNLTVMMDVPPTLEVTATLDGVPLPSYMVNGSAFDGQAGASLFVAANSPDGRVTTHEVTQGTWTISIQRGNGESLTVNQLVEFTAGQVTKVSAAFMTGTASLRGSFSSAFGAPGIQWNAHLKNLDDRRPGYAVHIEADNYSVNDVAPGDYLLIIFGGNGANQQIYRRISIADGEAKEFDIEAGGTASATFTRGTNLDESVHVWLTSLESPPTTLQLMRGASIGDGESYSLPFPEGEGSVSVSGIAPGDYWLSHRAVSNRVVPPGGTAPEPEYRRIRVEPGQNALALEN